MSDFFQDFFPNPDKMKPFFFVSIFVLMYLVETIKPKRKYHHSRGKRFGFHFGLLVFNSIVIKVLTTLPWLWLVDFIGTHQLGLMNIFKISGVTEILLTFVVFDCVDYWWHRFNHQIPFLWRFHKVHHVDIDIDVTSSLRFHTGELFFSFVMKSLFILLWGPSILGFALAEISISMASQFHHSNVSFKFVEKYISKVFVSQRFHLLHHTVFSDKRHVNFSTVFPWWDYIFKTNNERYDTQFETKDLGLESGRSSTLSPLTTLKAPFNKEY